MRRLLSQHWPALLLAVIAGIICLCNYTPGTFLSGWDTLHPEFNFLLNFSRVVSGVFAPEQGLGAVSAHSYIADLPHLFIVYLLSIIGHMQNARYFFMFLCYITGGIGMYVFLHHLRKSKWVCFLGGLFYLCNIGTVQIFFVPYEMFVVQFASLPWIFFFATDYIFSARKSSLLSFCTIAILSSPMAYAATLWYVNYVVFLSYVIFLGCVQRIFKPMLLLGILFPLLNLSWILPNVYFILFHGKEVTQAFTNQLFSQEAFLYNKEFGNVFSIATFKTFYFGWSIYGKGGFENLMAAWITHLNTPFFIFVQLLFFVLMVLGCITAIIRKKIIFLSLFPALCICVFFLANDNLPFHLYSVTNHIPLFQEAFRFPDDKILGIYVLIYSIFLTLGIETSLRLLKHIKLRTTFYILLTTFLFLYCLPLFQGQLIHPSMRITIPQEYFKLFDYMNTIAPGRVATLPIYSPWGWEYYDWSTPHSFQGSGFLSFGMKDPLLERDFDRWNPQNEAYYNEMSYAVYSQNSSLFQAVLQKYAVSYILLDTSSIAPDYPSSVLFYTQLQKLLHTMPRIVPLAHFNNHLFVYRFSPTSSSSLIVTPTLPTARPVLNSAIDPAFIEKGNYIATSTTLEPVDRLDRVISSPSLTFANSNTQDLMPELRESSIKNTCISQDGTKMSILTGILYTVHQGQYCDHANGIIQNTSHALLVHIVARNLSGLSLRLCISDPTTGHCEIQSKLPETKEFSTTDFLVPPLPTHTFSINLDTIGISPTTGQNEIASLSVEEIPFLSPLVSTATNTSTSQPITPLHASANSTVYSFSMSRMNNTTLILNQSYEPGWQLYKISNNQLVLPFLFSQPVGKHITINGWENGWILDKSSMTSGQYLIIFLPQYLEYLGFAIGGVALLTCLLIPSTIAPHEK